MRHAVPQDLHLSAGAVRLISRLPLSPDLHPLGGVMSSGRASPSLKQEWYRG